MSPSEAQGYLKDFLDYIQQDQDDLILFHISREQNKCQEIIIGVDTLDVLLIIESLVKTFSIPKEVLIKNLYEEGKNSDGSPRDDG